MDAASASMAQTLVIGHLPAYLLRNNRKHLGKLKSKLARQELEKQFHLVPASDKQRRKIYRIDPVHVGKIIYGQTEMRRTIGRVVSKVIAQYYFSSLPEMNALLQQYNVVADVNNSNDLEIWPNPVSNDLFIQNNAGVSSVIVYDLAGNKVHAARIINGVNNISLTALPTGKYFISVTQPDNKRKSYKIIKN